MKKRKTKIRENKGSDSTIVLFTSTSMKWYSNMKYACTNLFISVIITIKIELSVVPLYKIKGILCHNNLFEKRL